MSEVRLAVDEHGAIAVKRGAGADADRLRREASWLERLAHPGVVERLDLSVDGAGAELTTRYGGRPLAGFGPRPTAWVAHVASALAATVADLHDLGVVHGRIDATHVLVGRGGRPRLCGFAAARLVADGADPSTDVAALGHLFGDLLGPPSHPGPATRRRWQVRSPVDQQRRALLGLAARASAHDARRRPTARALGAAIDATPSTNGRARGRSRASHRSAMAAGGVAVLVASTALMTADPRGTAGTTGTSASPATLPPASAPAPAVSRCGLGAGVDITGDGCPDHVAVRGNVVEVGDARFTAGQPGDRVALGDWDCDGTATPAVLRPMTGEVFVFATWPGAGREVTVDPIARHQGATDLVVLPTARGCSALGVEIAGRRIALGPRSE
jgi:hypothetical protein